MSNSPRVVFIVSLSAGLTVGAIETLLMQNISFGWIALQTGVALMGAVAGATVINHPTWVMNKAVETKNYLSGKIASSFWSSAKSNTADVEITPEISLKQKYSNLSFNHG